MNLPFKRALCAALLMSAVPTAVSAADSDVAADGSAIATGMAIPVGLQAPRAAHVPELGRYVLVDAASARLYMIEDGHVRDSMRVIVGKPSAATPSVTSVLNSATINPYWNVPVDLARTIIAPKVLKEGTSYLSERGYEVVAGFSPDAMVLDPESVDWAAVADGSANVLVRQRPGPANSMGTIKIGVAGSPGIFLHDTPNKDLFAEAQRNLSNGCVRLEDAPRFARWLMGDELALSNAAPEQQVRLPRAVPIAITYLNESAQQQLASLD